MREELATAASKATAAAYAASGTGFVIGGLTANEFAALVCAGCAVVTAIANIYFRNRESKVKTNGKH